MTFPHSGVMSKTPVRQVLAHNLRQLMANRPDLGTQKKIEKRCGVSQSGVSQMLRPDNPTAKSPKLTQVEKVAQAFGLATWQLLLDPQTVGKEMAELLMRPPVQDDDKRLEKWEKPTAAAERALRGTSKHKA